MWVPRGRDIVLGLGVCTGVCGGPRCHDGTPGDSTSVAEVTPDTPRAVDGGVGRRRWAGRETSPGLGRGTRGCLSPWSSSTSPPPSTLTGVGSGGALQGRRTDSGRVPVRGGNEGTFDERSLHPCRDRDPGVLTLSCPGSHPWLWDSEKGVFGFLSLPTPSAGLHEGTDTRVPTRGERHVRSVAECADLPSRVTDGSEVPHRDRRVDTTSTDAARDLLDIIRKHVHLCRFEPLPCHFRVVALECPLCTNTRTDPPEMMRKESGSELPHGPTHF